MGKDQDNRDHPFYRVIDLLVKLSTEPGSYLSTDDLDSLGIKLSGMDINTGRPADDGPQFCDLYPSQDFDDLFENESIDYWPSIKTESNVYCSANAVGLILEKCLGTNYCSKDLISQSKYLIRLRDRSVFEGAILHCVDRGKYDEPEWQTSSILETQNKSDPHRACLLCDGAVSDDRLRRSEVCCAASLMAARLQKAKRTSDRIVPVFVYSLAGYKARVIQAHYQHPNFIVRKTEHVLFGEESVDSLKLMLRWMINIPKGDVKMPSEGTKDAEAQSIPQHAQVLVNSE